MNGYLIFYILCFSLSKIFFTINILAAVLIRPHTVSEIEWDINVISAVVNIGITHTSITKLILRNADIHSAIPERPIAVRQSVAA